MMKALHTLPLAAAVALTGFAVAGTAQAQQKTPKGWYKLCSKVDTNEICSVQYNIAAQSGRMVAAVNVFQSKGKTNIERFQIVVPTARFIPAGIKMKIDNGRENTIPYFLCMPDRCMAETPLTKPLVDALKKGGKIKLITTNFQQQKNPLEVSLSGFTKVFTGPPLKRQENAARQAKLKEELEKKAAETRKRLQEAQEKAKAGN